jgi:HEAT repeat protein
LAPPTFSDPLVAAAFWTGTGALLITVLLVLQIIFLRIATRRRERADQRVLDTWRPLLHAALVGERLPLPALARGEQLAFLKLWVHLQGSLRGEAREALNDVLRQLGVDASVRALLRNGRRAERLLAALTLGHLQDSAAWPELLRLSSLSDRTVALTAMWAMVRIDPAAAAAHIIPVFVERDDWAISRIAAILQEAAAPAAVALGELLAQLPPAKLPRALRIAEALRAPLPPAVVTAALASGDVALQVGVLRSITTPESIDAVRALLGHASWQVRVQAARALARIGERSDIDLLAPLLGDREWWVRYRAAQALASLAALYGQPLDVVGHTLSDRFARDMLAQVMAERSPA